MLNGIVWMRHKERMDDTMKAVFCDFYGTVVHENGPISFEVIKRIFKNSNAGSPEEIIHYWMSSFRKLQDEACGSAYRMQKDLALDNTEELVRHFNCTENPRELRDMMIEHWCNPPLYDDTKPFMDSLSWPVYFLTNSDNYFVQQAVKNHGLHPAGIITSEMARYAKPRKELFLYALETIGLQAHEVFHIGDSIDSDFECPTSIGIQAIWLNRNQEPVPEGIVAFSGLSQAQEYLMKIAK
jgi:HAD superfamily hydrolase (TIGR01549 family)